MREIRTSGLTRGEVDIMHGMRILSHKRGNPETEVGRNLNIVSPLLLYCSSVRQAKAGKSCKLRGAYHGNCLFGRVVKQA